MVAFGDREAEVQVIYHVTQSVPGALGLGSQVIVVTLQFVEFFLVYEPPPGTSGSWEALSFETVEESDVSRDICELPVPGKVEAVRLGEK